MKIENPVGTAIVAIAMILFIYVCDRIGTAEYGRNVCEMYGYSDTCERG